MKTGTESSQEIFSFHLLRLPLAKVPRLLFCSRHKSGVPGLRHAESFFAMNLGAPVLSAQRYDFHTAAVFAWWESESFLEEFLADPMRRFFQSGWHVRMRLYRRWGEVTELKNAVVQPEAAAPDRPVVAVTLARLKIRETRRFIRWGKPVEAQVRDHKGKLFALAGMRPLNTFSTFSIWKNESEMTAMVQGKNPTQDGASHNRAMHERTRKDFHHEFTTLRFTPFKESGNWQNKTNLTDLT